MNEGGPFVVLKIERAIEVNADVAAVWALVSSQDGFRSWFEPTIEIDPFVGGRHRHVSGEEGQLITGEILEMEPMKKLVLSWFEDGPDTDWVNPIRKTFLFENLNGTTRVTLVIEGFEGIGKPTYERTYEAYARGTARHHILRNLKETAEPSACDA